jgi:hypothetical protein
MKKMMLLTIMAAILMLFSCPAFADWIPCAGENQQCNVRGIRTVRYGTGNQWVERVTKGSVYCSNSVFGDPAPGRPKACYFHRDEYREPMPPQHEYHPPPADQGYRHHNGPRWVVCASEGQYCRFEGQREVKYGAGDSWSHISARHKVYCGNNVFGDPAPGVLKACYVRRY